MYTHVVAYGLCAISMENFLAKPQNRIGLHITQMLHKLHSIHVGTLHKVAETMPQQMCSVLKAKGGLLQKGTHNFLDGQFM